MRRIAILFLGFVSGACATQPDVPAIVPGHPAHVETEAAPAAEMSGVLEARPEPLPPLPVPFSDPTPESPDLHGPGPPRAPDVGTVGGLEEESSPVPMQGDPTMEHDHERH